MQTTAPGTCSEKDCPYSFEGQKVIAQIVFLGNASEQGPWLCPEHFRELQEKGSSFDIQQPIIDTSGPPTRRVKNTSRKRELEIAEAIGGRRQPGSGNQPFTKGDVRKKGDFRLEVKECFGLEFKAHRVDLLDKIRAECSRGEHPAVVITFRDKGTHAPIESWVMVPYEIWEERIVAGKHR